MEQTYSSFCEWAKVRHRLLRPLQRVDDQAGCCLCPSRIAVEHYGSSWKHNRRVTELHAQKIFAATPVDDAWPDEEGREMVVVEMDGGMVPIVEADAAQKDRRKGKRLQWKEAKLCLAHEAGSKTLSYGGTLQGDVAEAGKQLFGCARSAGFGKKSRVHAVGDGAEWIALQVEERFGSQGSYLVDYYHVCDYLSAAAAAIYPGSEMAKAWFDQQKERLKSGDCDKVIESLRAHLEADEVPDSEAAVRSCHRYLNRRKDQLDYPSALANNLPIGSGEIESAHRYIVQKRLKLPGSWWCAANADHMLALRLNRANGQWGDYWNQARRAA